MFITHPYKSYTETKREYSLKELTRNKEKTYYVGLSFYSLTNYFFLARKSAAAGRIAKTPAAIAKIPPITQPAPM